VIGILVHIEYQNNLKTVGLLFICKYTVNIHVIEDLLYLITCCKLERLNHSTLI